MKVKTIKNVDEETWRKFKVLSAKMDISMGILLNMMIKEFEKNNGAFWDYILTKDRGLSNVEAKDIEKITKKIRKEKGFRE